MATLDSTKATLAFDMTNDNLVKFNTSDGEFSTSWSWTTPVNNDLQLNGTGMTFDAAGHALSGSVDSIEIDLANDDFVNPDIVITGLNASASILDDSPAGFWSVLAGDDFIGGPFVRTVGNGISTIFGDNIETAAGTTFGGNDFISLGDASTVVFGDHAIVGSQTFGGATAELAGGNDQVFGFETGNLQQLVGDASVVFATGSLFGGDDFIEILSSNTSSQAVGDAQDARGLAGDRAEVFGGDDNISASGASAGRLIGDLVNQFAHTFVSGGNDTINGSAQGEAISGDVGSIAIALDQQLSGGDDVLNGFDGNDRMFGDAENVVAGGVLFGGNDEIHGGDGDDQIFGETGSSRAVIVNSDTSNNDRLFGDAGNDKIFGQSGNDVLDGGSGNDGLDGGIGADAMAGGVGNDIYAVDNVNDTIVEALNAGFDTVNAALSAFKLGDDVERVNFTIDANVVGTGNAGDNRFQSLDGDDRFVDVLGGADIFSGGGGTDTVDFRTSAKGAVLNFTTNVHAGAALGDTYASIEKFLGSDTAGDTMTGGGTGRFVFAGFGGNDKLTGGVKNDQLLGGDGNDTLVGGADRDALDGGAGTDRLDGGVDNDVLTGGLGVDTFVFAENSGVDRITDYDDAADLIDLTSFGFSNFNQVKALASDAADGSLILDFGNGDRLDIDNFRLANFDAGDVLI